MSQIATENIVGQVCKPIATKTSYDTLFKIRKSGISIGISNGIIFSIPQQDNEDVLYKSSIWVTDDKGLLHPIIYGLNNIVPTGETEPEEPTGEPEPTGQTEPTSEPEPIEITYSLSWEDISLHKSDIGDDPLENGSFPQLFMYKNGEYYKSISITEQKIEIYKDDELVDYDYFINNKGTYQIYGKTNSSNNIVRTEEPLQWKIKEQEVIPTGEPEPQGEYFWYLSNDPLTSDNIPHDVAAQNAQDHKGWRNLDSNTSVLTIPYVETDDGGYVTWYIAVPKSLGFDDIVSSGTTWSQLNGFNESEITVNGVTYTVWSTKAESRRISGFDIVKKKIDHDPTGQTDPSGNTEPTNPTGEIEPSNVIVLTDLGGTDYQHKIESNIAVDEWHISNDNYKYVKLNDDKTQIKVKAKNSINGRYIFETNELEVNKNEEFTLYIIYEENIVNDDVDVYASKTGYDNSNTINLTLHRKSEKPDFIELSNGMLAEEIDENRYAVTLSLNKNTNLYIENNANTNDNNHCNIVIRNSEPTGQTEPTGYIEGDDEYYLEWANTNMQISFIGDNILNNLPLLILYKNDIHIDDPDRYLENLEIYKDGEQVGYDDFINTKGTYDVYYKYTIENTEIEVRTEIPLRWKIKDQGSSNDEYRLEWETTNMQISFVGDDIENILPLLILYKNDIHIDDPDRHIENLEIYKDDELIEYDDFISTKGTYDIYYKYKINDTEIEVRTETPLKWKVKEQEENIEYRLEWDSTELKILFIGDDVMNNLPLLNLYKNDELIDNPDRHIENLEIYKDGEQVEYDDFISTKGTYDIYYKYKINDTEIEVRTEDPLRWKIKEQDSSEYRLEWDETEFRKTIVGEDIMNNLPLLNLYKNDEIIDNPDRYSENLEIYKDGEQVGYDDFVNTTGTYDVYYKHTIENTEIEVRTETPVRWKIKQETPSGTYWYLSNEALTEDNTPNDIQAQDAEDHKGWRELDPNTSRLNIPYVETDDGSYVTWYIAVPKSLGFNDIVSIGTTWSQLNGFNESEITVNGVTYTVWSTKAESRRISRFDIIKS